VAALRAAERGVEAAAEQFSKVCLGACNEIISNILLF